MTLARQTSTESPAAVVAAWQHAYAKRLLITDFIVIVVSVYGSQFIRFGTSGEAIRIRGEQGQVLELSYSLVSAILVLGWIARSRSSRTRDAPSSVPAPPSTSASRMRRSASSRCSRSPPSSCSPRSDAGICSSRCRSASRCCSSAAGCGESGSCVGASAGGYSHRAVLMGSARSRCTSPSRWPETAVRASSSSARSPSTDEADHELAPASPCSGTTRASTGCCRSPGRHRRVHRRRHHRPARHAAAAAGSSRPRRRTSSSRRRSQMSRARAFTHDRSRASRSSRSTIPSSRVENTPRSGRSTSWSRSSPSSCSARCSS